MFNSSTSTSFEVEVAHALLQTFAGLGLIFVGINFLSDNQKERGRPCVKNCSAFRKLRSPFHLNVIAGGFKKQSPFSLVRMVASCALTAVLLYAGDGSIDSSLLVLWATIDFAMVQFALLGAATVRQQSAEVLIDMIKNRNRDELVRLGENSRSGRYRLTAKKPCWKL